MSEEKPKQVPPSTPRPERENGSERIRGNQPLPNRQPGDIIIKDHSNVPRPFSVTDTHEPPPKKKQ